VIKIPSSQIGYVHKLHCIDQLNQSQIDCVINSSKNKLYGWNELKYSESPETIFLVDRSRNPRKSIKKITLSVHKLKIGNELTLFK